MSTRSASVRRIYCALLLATFLLLNPLAASFADTTGSTTCSGTTTADPTTTTTTTTTTTQDPPPPDPVDEWDSDVLNARTGNVFMVAVNLLRSLLQWL